jgi:hypothetical protein
VSYRLLGINRATSTSRAKQDLTICAGNVFVATKASRNLTFPTIPLGEVLSRAYFDWFEKSDAGIGTGCRLDDQGCSLR